MKKSAWFQNQINEFVGEVMAIAQLVEEESREMTDDESARVDELNGDDGIIAKAEKNRDRWLKIEARAITARVAEVATPGDRLAPAVVESYANPASIIVPATVRSRSALKTFSGPTAEQESYVAGLFYLAAFTGNAAATSRLKELGVDMAQTTGDNTAGGFLVPELLEARIIRLVEEYGVARSACRMMPMGQGGSISVPRRASGYTAYFVGENAAGTQSDLGFDQISLEAKKLMILSRWSSELPEDAVVQLGDLISQEVAYAFAVKEDDCLFNGDGTSTYGGIVGAANALAAGSIVDTAAGDDTAAEVLIDVFQEAIGELPKFPGIRPSWYVHQTTWANIMQRLAMAAGGNTVQNFEGGVGKSFLGYPVVISQSLESVGPAEDDSGTIFGYFGDFDMAATFGDKRGVTIAADSSIYFESDAIALRATERFDINVHERGTASAAGPLLALRYNAS